MSSQSSPLTTQQLKIVAEIRRLHKQDKPLNISAVRASRPDLLQEVYAIKPFWGWKRALESAGLDYHNIRIELSECVRCRICNQEHRGLSGHLLTAHEVSKEEYLVDYPKAELVSEEVRARLSRTLRA